MFVPKGKMFLWFVGNRALVENEFFLNHSGALSHASLRIYLQSHNYIACSGREGFSATGMKAVNGNA